MIIKHFEDNVKVATLNEMRAHLRDLHEMRSDDKFFYHATLALEEMFRRGCAFGARVVLNESSPSK